MKTLLLLRHAKSSWKDSGVDDHDRPLNQRGKRDAPRMGQLLKDESLLPDFIVSSSAKRARRTAECVAQYSGYRGETRVTSELYAADPDAIREVIRATPDTISRLLVVGHNPGLEELLEQLTSAYTPLSAGALARFNLEIDAWAAFGPEVQTPLATLWQPRELA